MGKHTAKKSKGGERPEPRKALPFRTLAALLAVGVCAMGGMALLNGNATPNRDMQWYLKPGRVEVAAPPMGEGYTASAGDAGAQVSAPQAAAASVEAPAPQEPVTAEAPAQEGSLSEGAGSPEGEAEGADAPEAPVAQEASAETADAPELAVAEAAPQALEIAEAPAEEAQDTPTEDVPEAPVDAPAGPDPEETPDVPEDVPVDEPIEPADGAQTEPAEEIPDGPVTITVTATGDCTFGGQDGARGRRRFYQLAKEQGFDYFFEGVRDIFESDDLTLVNLEGPLTTVPRPAKKADFLFKGDPEFVKILTGSSVEQCNLANNHTLDYGTEGIKETAKVLADAGIGYSGFSEVAYTRIKGVRVALMGFTWWNGDRKKIPDAVAEVRKNCDLLIVSMHWGTEYEYGQSEFQKELAHRIIDAGADLLIGNHPHVFQGIERYKGKYIAYSLGNFCFAGNADPRDKRALIFQQKFSFLPASGIAQAGIADAGINIIPVFTSSTQDMNDFHPIVMDAENGAKTLKSVAGHSEGLTFEDTLWMEGNYMEKNGLIGGEDAAEGEQAVDG